jgi:predicted DsbA family dithiol-disulfide isomerase
MKIEIWSDVMCPFCYIGKRRIEAALAEFPQRDSIEIEWKSYQLNPDMITDPSKSVHQYLVENKGISLQQAKEMNAYVTEMAKAAGLIYNLDKAIVANSMKAHRFSHFAKSKGKQDEAEELLFKAYFTDGKNTDDIEVLLQIAAELGLDREETRKMLESDAYKAEVDQDIYEASNIEVSGVPFFVFDDKYSISGAQDVKVFINALERSFAEWRAGLN